MTSENNIIILSDARAKPSLHPLLPRLKQSFPNNSIHTFGAHNFMLALSQQQKALAVIPGIGVEDSAYFDLLGGEKGQQEIKDFVERGNVLMTICAGSYFISKQTTYNPSWGPQRERQNKSALFNGLALGPVAGIGLQPQSAAWWDGCHAVPVSYKAQDGSWHQTKIAYGNGPALYPYQPDRDMEVLAHYDHKISKSIAAAWKKAGDGAVLWLGILPHTGYETVSTKVPEAMQNFVYSLIPHEKARQHFWSGLMNRVERHFQQTPG